MTGPVQIAKAAKAPGAPPVREHAAEVDRNLATEFLPGAAVEPRIGAPQAALHDTEVASMELIPGDAL